MEATRIEEDKVSKHILNVSGMVAAMSESASRSHARKNRRNPI